MKIETVTLTGEHTMLVPLSIDHVEALWNAGSDAELWRFTSAKIHSADDMRRYVETALGERERGVSIPFATVHRATGTVVGTTRFGSIAREHKRVEIGWT